MTRARPMLRRLALLSLAVHAGCGGSLPYEQTYLRASDNWTFRARYPEADHLFNGFDYGHAILSETLVRYPDDGAQRLEGPVYRRLTCDVLRHPPRCRSRSARSVRPTARLSRGRRDLRVGALLHRQVYDIIAAYRMAADEREARVAERSATTARGPISPSARSEVDGTDGRTAVFAPLPSRRQVQRADLVVPLARRWRSTMRCSTRRTSDAPRDRQRATSTVRAHDARMGGCATAMPMSAASRPSSRGTGAATSSTTCIAARLVPTCPRRAGCRRATSERPSCAPSTLLRHDVVRSRRRRNGFPCRRRWALRTLMKLISCRLELVARRRLDEPLTQIDSTSRASRSSDSPCHSSG